MGMQITKRFKFEAAHQLPWHNGKCARPHGHSYVLDVTVEGPIKPDDGAPDSGMVQDFYEISEVVKPVIELVLDHHNINDIINNPTAERMVEWMVSTFEPKLPTLCKVRLYETDTGWVEWTKDESSSHRGQNIFVGRS